MVSPPPDVGNKAPAATPSRTVASTPERGAPPPGGAAPALDRADIKPLDVTAALQILIAEVRESFVRLLIEAGGAAAADDDTGGGIETGSVIVTGGGVVADDLLVSSDLPVSGDVPLSGDVPVAGVAPVSGDVVAVGDVVVTGAAGGAAGILITADAVTTGGGGTTPDAAPAGAAMLGAWPPPNVDSPTSAARVLVEMMLQALPASADEAAWHEALPQADAALQSGVQRALEVVSAWRDVPPIVVQMTRESVGLALQVLGDDPKNPLWLSPEWLTMTPRLARFWRRRRVLRRRLTDPDYATDNQWDENDGYTP